ncbi:STAS domain-containing protein [Singulisphaera sp. PoT]|uniref:STAS domain-containing protein n=1 Tax=Singulisphaera sp. PoT TaxID=3411797 RepID=UPI003BF4CEA2
MSSASRKPFHREDVEGICTILVTTSELQQETADQLYQLGADAIASGSPKVVLNMANVESIKSAAIAVLLQFQKRIREGGGKLKICRLRSDVLRLLELTHSDSLFDIHKTQRGAVAAFLGRPDPTSGDEKKSGFAAGKNFLASLLQPWLNKR